MADVLSKTEEKAWKLGLPESRGQRRPSSNILAKIEAQMKGRPEPPPPRTPPAPEPTRVPQLTPFLDPKVKDKIAGDEFLRSQGKFEVEISFGTYKPSKKGGDMFSPGVTPAQFGSLLKVLKRMEIDETLVLRSYTDTVEIMESEFARRITDSDTGTVVWEKKFRPKDRMIENKIWGYRVSRSEEKFEAPSIPESKFAPDVIRHRNRHSFEVSDTTSDIYGFQFDLTQVKEVYIKKETKQKAPKVPAKSEKKLDWWEEEVDDTEVIGTESYSIVKYEVEIERNKAIASKFEKDVNNPITVKALENAIALVLYALQDPFLGVSSDIMGSQLISLPERQTITRKHNDLFSREIREIEAKRKKPMITSPYRLWKDYWNKPTNIRIDDFLSKFVDEYSVTLKLDGVRRFLFLTNEGSYAAGPPDDLWKIGESVVDYNSTLLDTEMYINDDGRTATFYVFDILFYRGRDIRGNRLGERLRLAQEVVEVLAESGKMFTDTKVEMKEFFTKGVFYERVEQAFEKIKETNFRLDGLIFQPGNWYKNNHTRKWKPASQLTIDFKLRRLRADDDSFELLVGGNRGEEIVFRGSSRYPYRTIDDDGPGVIYVENGKYDGTNADGVIAECKWNGDISNFEIYRLRDDRDKPNALTTALDVWQDINNPISETTIRGDTLEVMRRYHNMVKNDMLHENFTKGDAIMDWGSGRGGDLKKWEDVGLSKVFVVEPNETNLEELNRRLTEMKEKGYDPERVELVRNEDGELVGGQNTEELLKAVGDTKLKGIVSFFSLTYFGKDPDTFNAMIESIDQLLVEGSKFVGIVLDGDRVREKLEAEKSEQGLGEEEAAVISNPSFNIAQVSAYSDSVEENRNEIEISINDPTSMVKDQQEWLFYFTVLERELAARKIKLIKSGFLDNGQKYIVLPKDSKKFSEMNRYFVFQKTGTGKVKKPPTHTKYRYTKSIPEYTEAEVDKMIKLHNIYNRDDLYQVGIIRGKSSFVHAVIRAFDTKYFEMDEAKRTIYVKKIRQMMGRKATREMYDTLNNGELEEVFTARVMAEMEDADEKEAAQLGFLEYRLNIIDSDSFIGQQTGQELLSSLLGINILVLNTSSRQIVHLYGRDKMDAREAISMYAKTVILITKDNVHYSLVAKQADDSVYTVFGTEDKIVQDILNEEMALMEDIEIEEFSKSPTKTKITTASKDEDFDD